MTKRVKGPWHPPGTTPLEELTLVKQQLEQGRLPFPGEALVSYALLIVVCLVDVVRGQSLLINGVLILVSVMASAWFVRRYRRSRLEWLQAVEAWNRYKSRCR